MIYGKHGNCDGSELTENVFPPAATATTATADGHPEPPGDATVGVRAGHTKQLYLHLSDVARLAAVVFPLWHIRELHFSPAKLMCAQHFLHTRSLRRHCSHWTYISSSVAHPTAPYRGRSLPVPNASLVWPHHTYIYIYISTSFYIRISYYYIRLASTTTATDRLLFFIANKFAPVVCVTALDYPHPLLFHPSIHSKQWPEGVSRTRRIAQVTYSSDEEIIIYFSYVPLRKK